jgi:ADP-dependent NAD(P)H-hydrate dehydratase / NAD(P)H-hydrate epimerase
MRYALDSGKMKMIDEYTIQSCGIPAMDLMERAAESLVAVMKQTITKQDSILSVCGPGNNGGDGVTAGRILYEQGYQVAILFIGEEEKCSDQMRAQLERAKKIGIPMKNSNKLSEYNVIIDAIFGVGLSKPVTGVYEEIIRSINEHKGRIYSVDIPSGISADNGAILNIAVKADETVTFGYNKIGLLLYPGAAYAGKITVADIGFSEEAIKLVSPNTFYYDDQDLKRLPKRSAHSHKGTYGKVLIIAGSKGMSGAAYLSARAAYRSGVGLVKILSSRHNRVILQTQLPEALFAAYDEEELDADLREQQLLSDIAWASAIVVGPGLGLSKESEHLVETVLSNAKVPIILDADALNLLSRKLMEPEEGEEEKLPGRRLGQLDCLLPEGTILTPHLMELSRLAGIPVTEIANNLIDTARQCSYNSKLIYAVKDARTIVAYRDQCYINLSGNHGMATGGSGDALTGIIAAFAAAGLEPYEAACLAVYIHGLAGDEAAKERGTYSMMASDIAGSIEKVIMHYENLVT